MTKREQEGTGDGGSTYSLLSAGTSEEAAREIYRRIYGDDPERVIQTGGGTLVGPLPEAVVKSRGQQVGR